VVATAGTQHDLLEEVRAALESEPVQRELARFHASEEREPDARPLYRELGRLGLLAVNWPQEYGGRDLSLLDAARVISELVRAGFPDTLHVNTIQIVGLFLLLAGTPEQKAAYLPAFASGERFASVLYTEPGAGSDLASLRTTAIEDGDGWRLSGTKVFSLKSDVTDVGLCAARTSTEESKLAGITLFLVDLRAEGVRRAVIPSIADEQFYRVELHNVFVPPTAVVGEVGNGWPLVSDALAIERTGLDYTLKAERWLAAAVDGLAGEAVGEVVQARVGRFAAAVEASRLLAWSILERLADGVVDETRSAAAKYYSSELAQEVALWAAQVPALAGAPVLESAFREGPGLTLSAGTSEVMLQIVASATRDDVPEEPDADEVRHELRRALRNALAAVPAALDVRAPPASHGAGAPAWPALRRLGAPKLERGGFDLGLGASVLVCEELGRAGHGSPYPGVALCVHALAADGQDEPLLDALLDGSIVAAPAGFERVGSGRLAEQVVAAAADVDLFAVPAGPTLALVERGQLQEEPRLLPTGNALLSLAGVDGAVSCPLSSEVLGAARVRQAGYLLGLAEGAHAEATWHAGRRQQFGQALHAFQSIAFRLADAYVRIEALRLLVYEAARRLDDGEAEAAGYGGQALALAAETASAVTRLAIQICGARGLTDQTSLHRLYRLARVETTRFGAPDALWAELGEATLRSSA
jgi:alkylation response protein AidB-like acyl-CoA dehydrogenase